MVALAAGALRRRMGRAVFSACVLAGLLIAAVGVGMPGDLFLFSDSRGYARLLETIQSGAPLTYLLPTFTYEDWQTPMRSLVPWFAAGALALVVMAAAARWRLAPFWLVCLGALIFVSSAEVLASRPDASARDELARRGAVDLIWRFDNRLRAFEYRALQKIDETRLRDLSHVVFRRYPVPGFALPAGGYEARVWFAGALQRQGEIVVSSAQRVTFARHAGSFANPAVVPFDLPVAAGRLTVAVSDPQLASSVARTEIVATVLMSREDRETRVARRIEEVGSRPGAYLIYVDDHSYPEGGVFWTRGTERSEVLVAPGPYSRIRLTLHLGPQSGDVQVAALGVEKMVRVETNGSAEVLIEVPAGRRLMPIAIQSPTAFRPSVVDPRSDDARTLGVQVRVDLE
jgi:hypothetical protein